METVKAGHHAIHLFFRDESFINRCMDHSRRDGVHADTVTTQLNRQIFRQRMQPSLCHRVSRRGRGTNRLLCPHRTNIDDSAFEATARHGSFTGAARELGVTPAAVGQLVRALEEWVGHPLLHRARTGKERLTLVDEARDALADITLGLDKLESGLNKLRGRRARSVVVITASQVLVMNWLMERLNRFSELHNTIDLRLDVTERVMDVAHGVAIVRHALAEQLIATGQLVQLHPHRRWPLAWAYYIVTPENAGIRAEVKVFHDWLVEDVSAQ